MAKTGIRLLLIQGTLLIALSSLIFVSCKPSTAQESSPNVLIIFTDDMGYGDLSSFRADAVATPHIDRIGSEGVRCTDFHVPTPYCAPSRATLLTGRFPLRNGLIRNPTPDQGIDSIGISQEELLLGEVFQEAGYRTALIGKWHLGHREEFFPVNHGFDEYFGILYSNDMRPVQHIENRDTVEYPIDQQFLTQRYTKRAVEFIRNQDERPFFLHLCHPMPHKPLAASPNFYTPETPDDLYADVLRELDWSTGQIIQALEEEGILDKTVVLFLSDNGATYGGSNLPFKGRKHYTWEGGTRVPFLIRYPEALPGGLTVEEACWSGDIYPTLLSLAGIEIPEGLVLDGRNIQSVLQGGSLEERAIFSMRGAEIRTVRKGDWKLFIGKPRFHRPVDLSTWSDWRAPDGETIIAPLEQATPAQYPGIIPEPMEGEVFLFNLKEDASERVNLAGKHPEKVEELQQEYEAFMASLETE